MTTDPAVLLAARLDEAERIALAASPDGRTEWRATIQRTDEMQLAGSVVTAWPGEMPVLAAQSLGADGERYVTHAARNGPEAILAQVKADRDLLAEYEQTKRQWGREGIRAQTLAWVIKVRAEAWATPGSEEET